MRRRGFTLLEVLVALAILGLALMAIFDLNAGAVAMHAYSKRATVATLLARSKMIDLEQDLHDKGMPADDDEDSGDFSKEGWPSYKWRARILAPRTTGVSTDQLIAALFNIPVGEEGGGDMSELIGAMFGGGGGGDSGAGAAAGAGGLMSGAVSGIAQQQVTQFLDQIAKSVREVHLTVTWKSGNEVETLDLVTHVVSLGPGSDRNGGAAAGGTAAGTNPADPWVNARTGEAIQGEPLMRNNIPWDPNSPTDMVVHRSQYLMVQNRSPFGSINPTFGSNPGLSGPTRPSK
jgi:general secretion pathway protein I